MPKPKKPEPRLSNKEIEHVARVLAQGAHNERLYDTAASQTLANASLLLWGLLRQRGAVGPLDERG